MDFLLPTPIGDLVAQTTQFLSPTQPLRLARPIPHPQPIQGDPTKPKSLQTQQAKLAQTQQKVALRVIKITPTLQNTIVYWATP
jgi:hypothetical protein